MVNEKAVELVENQGIIFLDELDKVCGPQSAHGPDVSRQGVQRDLLPVVEGTTVNTRYGPVRTDHILFIAAGAFHVSKPSRPDAGVAGPLPDPRRADRPEPRRLPAHPLTADPEQSRPWFRQLRELAAAHGLAELSMGTTQDFAVAAAEGATYVRVGSLLFRN